MSVLADVSSSRRPDSFAELSCLERLMNSVMDVFFEPPGLPDLLGELENFICDQATEVFREVSGEMAHRFDANLPVGEIIPGVNLGSMRGSMRSEEHTSELQSLMRISYAVFCLKKKKNTKN